MDEGEIGALERVEEVVDERQVERVAVQLEDLERARRGWSGEVRAQGLPRGGREPQDGEAELSQVRRAEVDEERREEGIAELGVACKVYRADVGLVEGCCELDYDPWISLGGPLIPTGLYHMRDSEVPEIGSKIDTISNGMWVRQQDICAHSARIIPPNAVTRQDNFR